MPEAHEEAETPVTETELLPFLSVALGLYFVVAVVIFISIQALPPSVSSIQIQNLERRLVEVENITATHNSPDVKSKNTELQQLEIELQLLRNKVLELDKAYNERASRLEASLRDVDTSAKWQIATIWGIILAVSAAVIPTALSRRNK